RSGYAVTLATVARLWGSSFLFIKVAVRELAPATRIMGRLGLGALALAAIVPLMIGGRRTLEEIRQNAGWLLLVALVNVAVPFWLLSWGETRIDSGLASILQAAVPIFNAVVAFGFFREVRDRPSPCRRRRRLRRRRAPGRSSAERKGARRARGRRHGPLLRGGP